MTRQLILLNLILAALVAGAAFKIRERWIEGERQQSQALARGVPLASIPPAGAPPANQPVQAANYLPVAQNLVFAKDRNPNVIIEPEAPKPVKPVPPFPTLHGIISIGEPVVFLSAPGSDSQKGFKKGDKVGEFTLAAVSKDELVFEWEGKSFPKKPEDLKKKEAAPQVTGSPAAPTGGVQQIATQQVTTAPEEVEKAQKSADPTAPWVNTGGVNHACSPSDSAAPGTVVNGYRKVTRPSMFGTTCYWEPAR